MNRLKIQDENGQSMVIFALGIVAFIAMLALVLDGANAYAAKRQAQNAADAGALAGATYMCEHRTEANAVSMGISTAEDYAVLNDAVDPPQVYANLSDATVIVTATVQRKTFFAGVIGFPIVSPRAVAAAECRPPGLGVLPVAWSCRENVQGSVDCTEEYGPCRTAGDPTGMGCTYVIMDSVKVKEKGKPCDPLDPACYLANDLVCSPQAPSGNPPVCSPTDPTLVDCDLDNDCFDELAVGGARSWLDLNGGGGGANELKDWISGAVTPPVIEVHTWVPEESGVATSIFQTTGDHMVGKVVILPVFNKVCNGLPYIPVSSDVNETIDQCSYWTGDNQSLITNSTFNFHVISFSAFHVTCVQTGKNRVTAESGYFVHPSDKNCYGHQAAVSSGSIDDNDKTIEGYFVRTNLGGYGGPGEWYDTGTFTVVLTK